MASRQIPQATIVSQSQQGGRTTSSGQHLLLPDRTPQSRRQQTILVEVNSRDRNYTQKVLSNPFRWQFARPLKDVRSVELLAGTIPAQPYNIVDGANSFTFIEGEKCNQSEWVITIPAGRYTCESLILKLNELFACLDSINDYVFSIDPYSGKLIITRLCGGICFGILFLGGDVRDEIDRSDGQFLKQNTLALQLGFDLSDYYDCCGALVSPYPVDLASSTNRLYLYINLENSLDLGCIERGAGRRWPFAIIYLDEQTNGYKYLNKDTLTPASYSLPQPFSRLQNLYIDFRDEWYRPVNFDGKDFSLLLNITVLE